MLRGLKRLSHVAFDQGAAVALVAAVLYLVLAAPHIVDGDNAELAGLAATGGAAHPSGFPLYILWLRAWSWLPASSPAHAAALATALLGATQIAVLHAACRAWGARGRPAMIAVGLYAGAPIVLRLHTQAEVFALNGLVCAAVLWLSATTGPLRGTRRVAALALVAGLGLSNNLTCVLVAPVGLLGAIRGVRESDRALPAIAIGLAALALGLTPYAYLLAAPDTPSSWGTVDGIHGVVRHFLRQDYGTFEMARETGALPASAQLVALARTLGRGYLVVFALVAVGGLAWAIARPGKSEGRAGWIALAVSFLLAGPLLVIRIGVPPEGAHLQFVQKLHALPALLLAIPLALALTWVADHLSARAQLPETRRARVGAVLGVGAVVASASLSLPWLGRIHSPALELSLRNTLGSLPPNAVLFATSDEIHFGMAYLQGAVALRTDVAVVSTEQFGMDFARSRAERRTGVRIPRETRETSVTAAYAIDILATGRPLFIDPYQGAVAGKLPSYPYGLVFRVLPAGATVPRPPDVFAINRELFESFALGYALPGPDDQVATHVHRMYARTWTLIAKGLQATGDGEAAAEALAIARALAPEGE